MINRRTLKKEIVFSGISLHKGLQTILSLIPSKNDNIKIMRKDLDKSFLLGEQEVFKSSLSSNIGVNDCQIGTVEHLFAALHAFRITDLIIEIDSPEVPILDGSALLFSEQIASTGIEELDDLISPLQVKEKIEIFDNDKYISIEPNTGELELSYEIDFNHPKIGKQDFNIIITPESFVKELAGARTFGFLKDFEALKKMHLALGASLNNVVALDESSILNETGLRFSNEFARHKALDLLGDLYLRHPCLRQNKSQVCRT